MALRAPIADRDKEKAREHEIEIWMRTKEACEARVSDLQERMVSAKRCVEVKAGAVMAEAIDPLIAKIDRRLRKNMQAVVDELKREQPAV